MCYLNLNNWVGKDNVECSQSGWFGIKTSNRKICVCPRKNQVHFSNWKLKILAWLKQNFSQRNFWDSVSLPSLNKYIKMLNACLGENCAYHTSYLSLIVLFCIWFYTMAVLGFNEFVFNWFLFLTFFEFMIELSLSSFYREPEYLPSTSIKCLTVLGH